MKTGKVICEYKKRRSKRRWPGGWRKNHLSTSIEDAFANAKRHLLKSEPVAPTSWPMERHVMCQADLIGRENCIEVGGELFAKSRWFESKLRLGVSIFEIFSRSADIRTLAPVNAGSNKAMYLSVSDLEKEMKRRGLKFKWLLHKNHGLPTLPLEPWLNSNRGKSKKGKASCAAK